MSEDPVLLDVDGHVATVRLNSPPRNTMTVALMSRFLERIDQVKRDPSVRALVISSTGGHFCAGADLKGALPGEAQAQGGPAGTAERLRQVYAPFLAVLDLPMPSVAAVRKAAVGGGLGLASVCDFRVVTPQTRFLAPFVKLGIHPGMALTYLLPSLVGISRAKEMLLLGQEVRGEQALDWGLANRCVAEDQLEIAARELAGRLAAGAPVVTRWTRSAIHHAMKLDPRAAADFESVAQALTFLSKDSQEGLRAFLEKREPAFEGH